MKAASAGADTGQQERLLEKLLAGVREIDAQLQVLDAAHHANIEMADRADGARTTTRTISCPSWTSCASPWTPLEVVVDRDHWPVPTYNDMLFYV